MKRLAKIPCSLLPKDLSISIKLEEQPYIMLIPISVLHNAGISDSSITFDLSIIDDKISLIGPSVNPSPRALQSVSEDSAT